MEKLIPSVEEITPDSFLNSFNSILEYKKRVGLIPFLDNPADLLERAMLYATKYNNRSLGWASNIWSRSAANTVVINDTSEMKREHKILLLRVLEHVLAQGPLIKVDGAYGSPDSKVRMNVRVYVDPQFPDLAYRWRQLVFPPDKGKEPDATLFVFPHYLGNPLIPGTDKLMAVVRFPNQNFTVITLSSYQGEVKKGALCHWIYHAYKVGCTGEHAALREFSVKTVDGKWRRVILAIWGLTGSGKSTHGFYVWTERNSETYKELFGINPLELVKDQEIKNDDIVAICDDRVYGSELGAWTKTEDLTPELEAMWKGAMSPRALHENTEFDERGYPGFEGKLFQYFGSPNRNARSVLYLEDTGYFYGDVNSSGRLNAAVFLTPGYFTDFAWVKITDPAFAAKVLADGRTVGHAAQAKELVGRVRFVPRFTEFTIGVKDDVHVIRFYEFLKKWKNEGHDVNIYQWNTTGRIVAKYKWVEKKLGDKTIMAPEPILQEINGTLKPIGGERPLIEETELFLLQAERGAVEWAPHPVWGEKVLIPKSVPGIRDERLKLLNPLSYISMEEFKALLKAQMEESKYTLQKLGLRLPPEIINAMDFD